MENKELLQWISILLQYPSQDIMEPEYFDGIKEIANPELFTRIKAFADFTAQHSLEELTENYVQTFDFNERTNLYLTYSKLKEERERGPILVKLKGIYEDEGYEMDTEELPDYLPLFLEFISVAKEETVTALLPQFLSIIEELKDELGKLESPYEHLIDACMIIFDELVHVKGGAQ